MAGGRRADIWGFFFDRRRLLCGVCICRSCIGFTTSVHMDDFTPLSFVERTLVKSENSLFILACSDWCWTSVRSSYLIKLGTCTAIKGVMSRSTCAHLPALVPLHLQGFSAVEVFCLSLAESQIFLKVLTYDFNIINKAKIKCPPPPTQCHREQGSAVLAGM